MNINKLLTYQQALKLKYTSPYTFIISKYEQCFFYFGANHSRDYKNEQYKILETFWKKYISQTKRMKQIVVVEGGISKKFSNIKETIANAGENGFISKLARSKGVKIASPEPSLKFESDQLLKKYPKEEIEYYYFARMVHQWHSMPQPKSTPESYIRKYLAKDKKALNWQDFEFTLNNIEIIHKRLFKKPLDLSNTSFFNDLMNPYKKTKVNRIASESGRVRDLYILNELDKLWNKGFSMFVVYGSSHAVMQKPALETAI